VTGHPANSLDDAVHQRIRLGVLSIAHATPRVEFGYLQETLEVTAGNLSRHLHVLEQAGLVRLEKGYDGRRPRTWINLTRAGKRALRREVDHLKRIIATVEAAPAPADESSR
jgi:DNA-binding MarR family transcriptional regulator